MSKTTFKNWYGRYVDLMVPIWSPNTKSRIYSLYKNHLAEFDPIPLDEITLEEYQKFINRKLYDDQYAYNHVDTMHTRMMAILNSAVNHDLLVANKLDRVVLRYQPSKKIKYLEMDDLIEFDKLAKVKLNVQQYAMYVLMHIGWRRSEVLGLTHRAIDIIDSNTVEVSVIETKTECLDVGTPKTQSSYRTNRLMGDTAHAIIHALKKAQDIYATNGLIFDDRSRIFVNAKESKRKGRAITYSISYPYHVLTILVSKLNIKANPHKLRHSFATHAITQGMNAVEVSRWIGHSSVSTTLRIYTHSTKQAQSKLTQFANF